MKTLTFWQAQSEATSPTRESPYAHRHVRLGRAGYSFLLAPSRIVNNRTHEPASFRDLGHKNGGMGR